MPQKSQLKIFLNLFPNLNTYLFILNPEMAQYTEITENTEITEITAPKTVFFFNHFLPHFLPYLLKKVAGF